MKLAFVALMLSTTFAQADIMRWADITCWEGVNTRDHKTFTWVRQDGSKTRCKTYATRGNDRVLICDNGMTPAMRKFDDGHIIFNRVEMWNPNDDSSGVCD